MGEFRTFKSNESLAAPYSIRVLNSGSPKVLTKPGRYPRFPLRNWWARTWCGTTGRMSYHFYNFLNQLNLYQLVSDTVIEFQGLTIVQVSQNQAAVVSDPQNHVFVIKNAGFVAYAIEGTYNVLSIVDQTHLPTVIKDKLTGITLGSTHEVKMRSKVGNGQEKEYVVATLLVFDLFQYTCFDSDNLFDSLNIPASNCAILQRGDDLELLGAGQSVITNPSVTLRGMYTLGENQLEMPTKDMYVFSKKKLPWNDLLSSKYLALLVIKYLLA